MGEMRVSHYRDMRFGMMRFHYRLGMRVRFYSVFYSVDWSNRGQVLGEGFVRDIVSYNKRLSRVGYRMRFSRNR